MAAPTELSIEQIRMFMLNNGGKVTNHELVTYFKLFLTDPENKEMCRMKFKQYVNELATMKNVKGEKVLYLKEAFRSFPADIGSSCSSLDSAVPSVSPLRQPPPYRAPPAVSPVGSPTVSESPSVPSFSAMQMVSPTVDDPPAVPPRKRSTDKIKLDRLSKENVPFDNNESAGSLSREISDDSRKSSFSVSSDSRNLSIEEADHSLELRKKSLEMLSIPKVTRNDSGDILDNSGNDKSDEVVALENKLADEKISVKERMLKFNRLASETNGQKLVVPVGKKKCERGATYDDDRASVTSMDPKSREWLIQAAKCDYQDMAKMANENTKFAHLKDPTTTALHWAAKHGDENVVKLIAGTLGGDVNARTGYTPLHIAMQFDHENIYQLLVRVYAADPNIRDFSGRKPRQYLHTTDTSVSADTFRKIKARKKHSDKDLGFLRIGSLNVRVKRTTEAFTNFLGVGPPRGINRGDNHAGKGWGSADNIPQVERMTMPPPKMGQIKKRRSRRPQDFPSQGMTHSQSMPTTPNQGHQSRAGARSGSGSGGTASPGSASVPDSDSDTACGFDDNWKGSKPNLKAASYI